MVVLLHEHGYCRKSLNASPAQVFFFVRCNHCNLSLADHFVFVYAHLQVVLQMSLLTVRALLSSAMETTVIHWHTMALLAYAYSVLLMFVET